MFVKEYGKELKKPNTSRINCSDFGPTFDALVAKLDKSSGDLAARQSETESASASELTPPSSSAGTEDGLDDAPPPPPVPGFKKGELRTWKTERSLLTVLCSCTKTNLQRSYFHRCYPHTDTGYVQAFIPGSEQFDYRKGRPKRIEESSQSAEHLCTCIIGRRVTRQEANQREEGISEVKTPVGY